MFLTLLFGSKKIRQILTEHEDPCSKGKPLADIKAMIGKRDIPANG